VDEDELPDWLRKAAHNTDALLRSAWPIIRAAQECLQQAAPRTITGSASLTATATVVAYAGVATAVAQSGDGAVEAVSGSAPARPIDIVTFRLVILLLIALDMTLAENLLPPEKQQMLINLITNIGVLLAIITSNA
jgi:hypothetical protein